MIDYYEALSGRNRRRYRRASACCTGRHFFWNALTTGNQSATRPARNFTSAASIWNLSGVILPLWELRSWRTASWDLSISAGADSGRKLSKLATLYVLILKLIYDEQMSSVSTSVNVVTTLSEINEKIGSYRLLKTASVSEIRRSLAFLKKYQVIEPLDVLEDLDGFSRLVIYPTVNVILMGDDVRALLETFREGEEEDGESEI